MQWKILQRRVPPLCLLVMSKSTHLAIDIYDISIINPAVIFFRPSLGFPAVFWDFRYFSEFSCGGREETRILGVSCIFFLLEASSGGDQRPFGHQHYHCQIWRPCQRTAFFAESVMISMLYLELPHNLMQENFLSQGLAPIFEGGFPSRVGMGDPSPIGEEKPAALKT